MSTFLTISAILIGSLYALWVLFLAVMNLKRVQEQGKLSKVAYRLGLPVVWLGYALDAFVNATLMTLILLEMPRWPHETLVTDRLKRHHAESQGWRLKVVLFFEPILDPFDPSGDHV